MPKEDVIVRESKNRSATDVDLNILIKFDGNREKLSAFLNNCRNAVELATRNQQDILLKYIVSQLEGRAETACCVKEFENWHQLKEFLKSQFGDKKHYAALLSDLQECRQLGNETVNQFALRIGSFLSTLLSEINITIPTKKKDELAGRVAAMKDLALHTFVVGLNPRLSTVVRCRDPESLNDAINFATSAEKIINALTRRNTNYAQTPNTQNQARFRPSHSSYPPNRSALQHGTNNNTTSAAFRPSNPIVTQQGNQPQNKDHIHISKSNVTQQGNQPQNEDHAPISKSKVTQHGSQTHSCSNVNKSISKSSVPHNPNSNNGAINSQQRTYASTVSGTLKYMPAISPLTTSMVDTPNTTPEIKNNIYNKIHNVTSNPSEKYLPFVEVQTSISTKLLRLLVDSGASISLIKKSSIQNMPEIDEHTITFSGIGTADKPMRSFGRIPIEFNSLRYRFHIIDNINFPYDGIIGNDFLSDNYSNIDFKNESLTISQVELALNFNEPIYTIAPRTETIIECSVLNPEIGEGLMVDQNPVDSILIANCFVKDPGSKLVRWRLKLEEFDYNIEYKKGKIAAALSRFPVNPIIKDQTDSQRVIPSSSENDPLPFSPLTIDDLGIQLPSTSNAHSDSLSNIDLLENDEIATAPRRAALELRPRALVTDRLPSPLWAVFTVSFYSLRVLRWFTGHGWHCDWLESRHRLSDGLDTLRHLVEGGQLSPVLDKVYFPQDFEAALAHACSDEAVGTTVIRFP
ncbi:unnamed protein product [Pieris brassicae]|uniref:Peptidase A2 domain-containing protein n=1 Tax=Pieris brassicae TaxID=7116 RepID=A0A9P0SWW6_PIEBR|nr:unnamed protein product [Pieris brassicae]